MSDKMEMSLDEIIENNPGNFESSGFKKTGERRVYGVNRGRGAGYRRPFGQRGSFRGGRGFSRVGGAHKPTYFKGDVNSVWRHDLYDGIKKFNGGASSAKLSISNLDYGVSEQDLIGLFQEFGTLRSAKIHYDRSGRSLGTAEVIFDRQSAAAKALAQYNGVPLDGRPMVIAIVQPDFSAFRAISNGSAAPTYGYRRTSAGAYRGGYTGYRNKPFYRGERNPDRREGRSASYTAAELDAELDAYVNKMK